MQSSLQKRLLDSQTEEEPPKIPSDDFEEQKDFKDHKIDDETDFTKEFQNTISVTSAESSLLEYKKILDFAFHEKNSLKELIQALSDSGITFNSNFLAKENFKTTANSLVIHSIQNTKYMQVAIMNLSLGPFSQTIRIYNTLSESIFGSTQSFYEGNSTKIFNIIFKGKKLIAKATIFKSAQEKSSTFKPVDFIAVLQEYFVTKMMSVLKIGPKLFSQFGFDIFVSDNDAFFILESCQEAKFKGKFGSELQILKKNLRQMHQLSIVHRDIKPDNIMWSPSFEKFVFIDFGISESRNESVGQLILTNFMGTYAYCYDEMKKIFKNRQKSWASIHLNDAYGLQVSIEQISSLFKQMNHKRPEKVQISKSVDLSLFFEEVQLKFKLLTAQNKQNISEFNDILRLPPEIGENVINFLYQIPQTEKIRQIYKAVIEQTAKKYEKFDQLNLIFESPIYFKSCKGQRNLTSAEEAIQKQVKSFYADIRYRYCNDHKFDKISIEKLEQVLFDNFKIEKLQPFQYELYIIEYLNIKRMNPVDLVKKTEICQKFLITKNICSEEQIQGKKCHELILIVFHQIILQIPKEMRIKRFFQYIRALQNYFIMQQEIDFKILQQLNQIILILQNNDQFTELQKIQRYLLICLSFWSTVKQYPATIYSALYEICLTIHQKVLKLAQNSWGSSEQNLCKIYATCMKYFYLDYNTLYNCDFTKLLSELSEIQHESSHSFRLMNFVRYRLLTQIQKGSNVYIQKKQLEKVILQEMKKDQEINSLIVAIVNSYYLASETTMSKSLISLFDTCIQIEQISERHFWNSKLQFLLSNQALSSQEKEQKYKEFSSKYFCFKVDQNNFVKFFEQFYQFKFVYAFFQQINFPIPRECLNDYVKWQKQLTKVMHFLEKCDKIIYRRGSKNLFKFLVLEQIVHCEFYYEILDVENRVSKKFFQKRLHLYPISKTFKKIVEFDRNCLENQQEKAFFVYHDIIQMKFIHKESASRQILNYLHQRKQYFCSLFNFELTFVKNYICCGFGIALKVFLQQGQSELIKEGVELIYSIVEKMASLEIHLWSFNQYMIQALIQLQKFTETFEEIHQTSKYFSNYVSVEKLSELMRFYQFAIKNVVKFSSQSEFFKHLNTFLQKIDLERVPAIGVLLLLCIRKFNSKKYLRLSARCLAKLKFNGKYLYLRLFYKEFLNYEKWISKRKREILLKRSIKYGTKEELNLERMKKIMTKEEKNRKFEGIYLGCIEKKMVRLGEYCSCEEKIQQVGHYLRNQV